MVLSELRGTYWGADFTYRLFECAQKKLAENKDLSTVIQLGGSDPIRTHNGHVDIDTAIPPTSNQNRTKIGDIWSDDPHFPTFDQLLSPAFTLSENTYQYFLTHDQDLE